MIALTEALPAAIDFLPAEQREEQQAEIWALAAADRIRAGRDNQASSSRSGIWRGLRDDLGFDSGRPPTIQPGRGPTPAPVGLSYTFSKMKGEPINVPDVLRTIKDARRDVARSLGVSPTSFKLFS